MDFPHYRGGSRIDIPNQAPSTTQTIKFRQSELGHECTYDVRSSLFAGASPEVSESALPRVLVFSKTAGFRHDAIAAGIATVRALGAEGGLTVDATEDAAAFTPENLSRYRSVVFLNTSGDVLDARQKAAFQGFIKRGGGLAAIHQGITTLEKWPWYVDLVGGVKFAGHPEVQEASCSREDRNHPATDNLPESWKWRDEWYNFEPNPRAKVHVLVTVDETSYHGGKMGKDHPVSWYREAEGGRVWCTALGHTKEGYDQPILRQHLLGGIQYAAGLAPAEANRVKREDRRLDPQARAFLEKLDDSDAPGFEALPVSEARKAFLAMRELAGPPEPVDKVEDRILPGDLKVRIYTPAGPGPKPAVVYFHGGGWVLGGPETIDAPCRRLANASACVVVSVDYRRPPEHPLSDAGRRLLRGHPSCRRARGVVWSGRPADRRGRRQRRRQPGRGRNAHGTRSRRSGAGVPAFDLSGYGLRFRHAVLPVVRAGICVDRGSDALVLGPLPRAT